MRHHEISWQGYKTGYIYNCSLHVLDSDFWVEVNTTQRYEGSGGVDYQYFEPIQYRGQLYASLLAILRPRNSWDLMALVAFSDTLESSWSSEDDFINQIVTRHDRYNQLINPLREQLVVKW